VRDAARRILPALLLILIGAGAPADSARPPGAASPVVAAADTAGGAPEENPFGPWVDDDEARRFAKVPWRIGEYFQFSVDWNGLNGGSSLMQVQNLTTVGGRRAYRIVTKTESNSFVSKFYKVRDRAESYIDAESLVTLRFVKHLREGGYKKDIDVRFDQEAHKAVYDDGETVDVPAAVHDVLSAFYYVRTLPLPDGAVIQIPTPSGSGSVRT